VHIRAFPQDRTIDLPNLIRYLVHDSQGKYDACNWQARRLQGELEALSLSQVTKDNTGKKTLPISLLKPWAAEHGINELVDYIESFKDPSSDLRKAYLELKWTCGNHIHSPAVSDSNKAGHPHLISKHRQRTPYEAYVRWHCRLILCNGGKEEYDENLRSIHGRSS
jgi:hypothetical protein